MDALFLWTAGAVVTALLGVFVWLDRCMRREMKRDADRRIFPSFHENRELRQRLKQLREELGEPPEQI